MLVALERAALELASSRAISSPRSIPPREVIQDEGWMIPIARVPSDSVDSVGTV
jgi:hypothetical protein